MRQAVRSFENRRGNAYANIKGHAPQIRDKMQSLVSGMGRKWKRYSDCDSDGCGMLAGPRGIENAVYATFDTYLVHRTQDPKARGPYLNGSAYLQCLVYM